MEIKTGRITLKAAKGEINLIVTLIKRRASMKKWKVKIKRRLLIKIN